ELELVALAVGRGPRAALTIKAGLLIDGREDPLRVPVPKLLERDLEGLGDSRQPGRRVRRVADRDVDLLDGWLSADGQVVPISRGLAGAPDSLPDRRGRLDHRGRPGGMGGE